MAQVLNGHGYMSPEAMLEKYGDVVGRELIHPTEIEDAIDAALMKLDPTIRATLLAHFLHSTVINGQMIRFGSSATVRARCRALNLSSRTYYDHLGAALFHLSRSLGLDGA